MKQINEKIPAIFSGLSGRLLLMTMGFVMLAEILIWTPSIARFHKVYLEERLLRAHLSTLALDAVPEDAVDSLLKTKLLKHADAYGISISGLDRRMLMVSGDMPPKADRLVDMTKGNAFDWIMQAFDTLAQDKNRILRVMGYSPKDPRVMVEILLDEAPLRKAMVDFSTRILTLSIGISLFTAGLVYLTLQLLMIRPMRRITQGIKTFREAPEDVARVFQASNRRDEIGIAGRELAVMQNELRGALRQKGRLATLGAAVAKINHDLRNSLATAVLAFDRLAHIDDPEVKSVLPRMYDAVDRAVNLCSQTLNYAADADLQLECSHFHLSELISETWAQLKAEDCYKGTQNWQNDVPFETSIFADRRQLFRVFSNLARNSLQAGATTVKWQVEQVDNRILITLTDDGPGFGDKARKKLFQPFAGSERSGGTGLGLVIAREVMKAHGGDITLMSSSAEGTVFLLDLGASDI